MTKHKDQVWLVQFCNGKGDRLASVCKDSTICIWVLKWQTEQGYQAVEIKCQRTVVDSTEDVDAVVVVLR